MRTYTEEQVREILEIQKGMQVISERNLSHARDHLERMKKYPQFFPDEIQAYKRGINDVIESQRGIRSMKRMREKYVM